MTSLRNGMIGTGGIGRAGVKNGARKRVWAGLAGILLFGGTAVFADLNNGLVAYYPFEGNASDGCGNGNNGVLYNQPSFVPGRIGQAIRFNGVDQYVEVAASNMRDFYANPFSIVFWFRTTEQDWGYMLDSRTAPPEQGFGLIIHTSGPGIVWGVQNDGQYYMNGGPQVGPHNNSYQDGQWHLVAGLREQNAISIYLDGSLVERMSIPADLNVGSAKPLRIGTRFQPNGPWDYYTGDIDELRIYNRALSEAEIQQFLDSDGDGVPDASDQCPGTPAGEVVNAEGCSISQLAPPDGRWKNHGEYVSAVTRVANDFMAQGLVTGTQKGAIVAAAARSDVGK